MVFILKMYGFWLLSFLAKLYSHRDIFLKNELHQAKKKVLYFVHYFWEKNNRENFLMAIVFT